MIEFTLKDLLKALDRNIINKPELNKFNLSPDTKIADIFLDSRKVIPGSIFIALVGENTDGHQYLAQVQENGAQLAIVTTYNHNINLPQIVVANTKLILGVLTKYLFSKWNKPAVTITGSSGKTTTKFILNAILSVKDKTLCAESSFNNDIGVPLTMFNANNQHWAGIFEMGTNHPGEIAYLADLVESKVAMLLNVSAAHIGNFPNVEAILHEKSNIFNGLGNDGIAVIDYNLKQESFVINKINEINKSQNKKIKLLTFGLNQLADCFADNIKVTPTYSEFRLNYNKQSIVIKINLLGEHQILNALAASLAALCLGISFEQIKRGCEQVLPVTKRMHPYQLSNNLFVIDDSYNANPASVAASVNFLAGLPGKKIFVLGNLGELGEHRISVHTEIGKLAKSLQIDKVLALGEDTKYTLQAFYGNSDLSQGYFETKQDLFDNLLNYLSDNSNYSDPCTILIKGSNYMRMWEITELLRKNITENI